MLANRLIASCALVLSLLRPIPHEVPNMGDVMWPQRGTILNQGNIGACSGFAVSGLIGGTDTEGLVVYRLATRLDGIPGAFPRKDTGTTVHSAMEAAKDLKLIPDYADVFNASTALYALHEHPLVVALHWSGAENHAVILRGREGKRLVLQNSWGEEWGDSGLFTLDVNDFARRFINGAYIRGTHD